MVNRRALGLALGVFGGAPGCGDCEERWPEPLAREVDESEPPRIREGRFVDEDTVELVFTEALGPVDEVDPRKFRLSTAKGETDSYLESGRRVCYQFTYYYDLSDGIDDPAGCVASLESCPQPTTVHALELYPGDSTRLHLEIHPPLADFVCRESEYVGERGGIFVHFAAAESPTIQDTSGQRLEDIAPHWVISGDRYATREGIFPVTEDWLPIPCRAG